MKSFFSFIISILTFAYILEDSTLVLASNTTLTDFKEEPLFSRKNYIKNYKKSNYIKSILACLYTIPTVQKAFYDESLIVYKANNKLKKESQKSSIAFSISVLFAKLRTSQTSFEFNKFFFSALKNQINWNEKESVLTTIFWTTLSQNFPSSIKVLFDIKVQVDWINPQSHTFLVSEEKTMTSIRVPIWKNGSSLADYIESKFYDEKFVLGIKYPPNDLKAITILATPLMTILNTPEVLVFRLERNEINPENRIISNLQVVELNDELLINGRKYKLTGNIVFNHRQSISYADVLDFGNGKTYRHDCSEIFPINSFLSSSSAETVKISAKATNTILAFYTLKDSVSLPFNKEFYASFEDIPSFLKPENDKIDRKRKWIDGIEPENIQNNEVINLKSGSSNFEKFLSSNSKDMDEDFIKYWLDDISDQFDVKEQDFVSKSTNEENEHQVIADRKESPAESERLGNGIYSFKYIDKIKCYCAALEMFLSCIASDQNFTLNLFNHLKNGEFNDSVEMILAVVITKMLLGQKNISLDGLVSKISIKTKTPKLFFYNSMLKSELNQFNSVLNKIIESIDPNFISIPEVEIISYESLKSNRPIMIEKHKNVKIEPRSLFPLLESEKVDRGILFDSLDINNSKNYRRKFIFNSSSFILPVEIERFSSSSRPKFFDKSLLIYETEEFKCIGFIGKNLADNNLTSYFIDEFNEGFYRIYSPRNSNSSSLIKINELTSAQFNNLLMSTSLHIFFVKISNSPPRPLSKESIPLNILKLALEE